MISKELLKIAKLILTSDWDDEEDSIDLSELKYKHITPLKMNPAWSDPETQKYNPRPQGFSVGEKHLAIIYEKTDVWSSIKHKVRDLSYSEMNEIERGTFPKLKRIDGQEPKYASIVVTNVSAKLDGFYKLVSEAERKYIIFNNGWDSSYHDAQWNGVAFIVAFGSTANEALERRNKAFKALKIEDTVLKKFQLRKMVRDGD